MCLIEKKTIVIDFPIAACCTKKKITYIGTRPMFAQVKSAGNKPIASLQSHVMRVYGADDSVDCRHRDSHGKRGRKATNQFNRRKSISLPHSW